jgi:tetratricopeptide (TPR) repeat protein
VTYQEGLGRFPQGVALNKAAGRLATSLNWAEPGASVPGSSDSSALATGWLTSAFERDTTDMETRYYLGLAALAQGRDRDALGHFEAAQRFAATAAPARLQLARMASRAGDIDGALRWLRALVDAEPDNAGAGALEVACLRRAKQPSRARERLAHWRALDPTSLLMRFEAVRLGAVDARLWRDMAADSERVLDLVDQYLALGDLEAALDLLTRAYPAVAAPASEPGAVAPADNPLLAYYRGFVRQKMGGSGNDDFRAAARLPLTYVFPSRRSSYAVLHAALAANPDDGRAMFLLGALHLADGLFDAAIADWSQARTHAAGTHTLARNLGMTLLHFGRVDAAVDVLTEGVANDPQNVEVYTTLDAALSAREAPAPERAAALERYPDQGGAASSAGLPAGAGEGRERRHRSGRVVPRSILPARGRRHRARARDGGRARARRPRGGHVRPLRCRAPDRRGPDEYRSRHAARAASDDGSRPRPARAARAGTRRVVVRRVRCRAPAVDRSGDA